MSLISTINNLTSKILDLKATFRKIASDNNIAIPINTLFKEYPKYFMNVSNLPLGKIVSKFTATVEESTAKTSEVIKSKFTATVEESTAKTSEVIKSKFTATVEEDEITTPNELEIVGTLTHEGDNYGSFTDNDYILYAKRPYIAPTDDCTISLFVTTGEDISTKQFLISGFTGIQSGKWYVDGSTYGACLANTEYHVKLVCNSDGTTSFYYGESSTLEEDYTLVKTITRSKYNMTSICKNFKGILHNGYTIVEFE